MPRKMPGCRTYIRAAAERICPHRRRATLSGVPGRHLVRVAAKIRIATAPRARGTSDRGCAAG
jgi:hypothetical protein